MGLPCPPLRGVASIPWSAWLTPEGGNPANRDTILNMDPPELRNAVVQLLTVIDDSDDMDVVVTVADDGTVVVEAA